MLSRRRFVVASAASAFLVTALADKKKVRVGILSGLPREKSFFTPLILKELAARGYEEERSMHVVFRYADDVTRFPALATELANANCDVIIGIASAVIGRALKGAQTTTPIVLLAAEYDPVEIGIVKSFARPEVISPVFSAPRGLCSPRIWRLLASCFPARADFLCCPTQ